MTLRHFDVLYPVERIGTPHVMTRQAHEGTLYSHSPPMRHLAPKTARRGVPGPPVSCSWAEALRPHLQQSSSGNRSCENKGSQERGTGVYTSNISQRGQYSRICSEITSSHGQHAPSQSLATQTPSPSRVGSRQLALLFPKYDTSVVLPFQARPHVICTRRSRVGRFCCVMMS